LILSRRHIGLAIPEAFLLRADESPEPMAADESHLGHRRQILL
jgi:hypothetical protein